MEKLDWSLANPLLILYTQLDILALPELQFKVLFENEVKIPKHIHVCLFGEKYFSQGNFYVFADIDRRIQGIAEASVASETTAFNNSFLHKI